MRAAQSIKGFKIGEIETLLSLYADGCSIFLEYDSSNLENAILMLNDFYEVSGLQIHLNKTQCVVFGQLPVRNYKLCDHFGI